MDAETIARALGGHRTGAGWVARCPAHDDRTPSLSIRDGENGRLLLKCFADCLWEQIAEALRARDLSLDTGGRRSGYANAAARGAHVVDEDANRTRSALRLWRMTTPGASTLVETYLRSRAIYVPVPSTLRFAELRHPSGGSWPAMVALVTRGTDDTPLAIHRTFLVEDGGKAPLTPDKMMLGPCRGGAVRLAMPGGVLMVGEGIETVLSAVQATGLPGWAALSTSGLRALDLPDLVREVIVLADADDPGEAAAQACAWRWKREGRRVRIARPPRGNDFNDTLNGGNR
jgi:hypothetical protein